MLIEKDTIEIRMDSWPWNRMGPGDELRLSLNGETLKGRVRGTAFGCLYVEVEA